MKNKKSPKFKMLIYAQIITFFKILTTNGNKVHDWGPVCKISSKFDVYVPMNKLLSLNSLSALLFNKFFTKFQKNLTQGS